MKFYNLLILFIVFISLKNYSQTNKIDSLNSLSKQELDSNGIKKACRIAMEVCENEPQQCINYANKIITNSNEINYFIGEAKLYNIKGICFDVLSQYDSAIANYNIAFSISDKNNLQKTKASALNNLGLIYWNIGNYDLAIKNYFLALKQFESLKLEPNIASATNNIGLVYADMNNFKEALNFYFKAIALHRKSNNEHGVASVLTNIGIIYYNKNEFEKAASYLDSSIIIKRRLQDDYGLGISLNHRAEVSVEQKEYKYAEELLIESTNILAKIGNKNMLFSAYNNLARLFKKQGKFKEATSYTFKTVEISKEIGSLRKQGIALGNLSLMYRDQKDYENAYRYLNECKAISDSILNIENFENINEMKEKYETEKKEKENTILILENNKQKTKNLWIVFISLAVTVLITISVWFLMYKRKQQLIKQQNIKLTETIIETEHQERERIAKDLHDSVGQKLSVVKMQMSIKNNDNQTASNLLDEAIQDVRAVSHNLMPADLSKGLITAVENMCEQINFSSTTFKIHINKTNSINNLILDKQHTLLIYRITQELINNAIKHAQAKNIHINMDCEKNLLNLNLKDDGVGFDTNILTQKDGLGIKSIKNRVEQLMGTINIKSQIGIGTEFNIFIPV